MVLYSETVYDLEKLFHTRYVRTKIFDEEGRRLASVEIPYDSPANSLEDFHARTIHADGTVVEFAGQPQTIWKFTMRGRRPVAVFTLPEITPGSLVEYRYRIQIHRERLSSKQSSYVPARSEVKQLITQSRYFYWALPDELYTRQGRFIIHPPPADSFRRFNPDYRTEGIPAGTVVTNKNGTLACEARDIPAASKENLAGPELESRVRIEMYFREHQDEKEVRFWSRYSEFTLASENDFLGSDKLARHIAAATVPSGDAAETKLRKLYSRAQALRNLDFTPPPEAAQGQGASRITRENVTEVLQQGSGSSREINLAFMALTRGAGFEADSVHLASRNIRRLDPHLLDWSQLDTTAVWVHLGDSNLILDPGTPSCPYGHLPWQKSSSGGLRLGKRGWQFLTTTVEQARDSRITRMGSLQVRSDGTLQGTVQVLFFGQEALELRLQSLGASVDEGLNTIRLRIRKSLPKDAVIERLEARGWESGEEPLSATFYLSLPAAADSEGRTTLPLLATVAGGDNPFEEPVRVRPVWFPYPFEEIDEIHVVFPENAVPEHLPQQQAFSFNLPGVTISAPLGGEPEGLRRRRPGEIPAATLHRSLAVEGNVLTVKRTLVVACETVKPDEYGRLRDFFSRLKIADEETVTIRSSSAAPRPPLTGLEWPGAEVTPSRVRGIDSP